ncbi:putative quinol monooxygenase [Aureimonas mangrovi]|uniref:putative quinol monooxygenase n=1 Tax=Aureimonas mangrovi TaxID=2758041 RepID=UPI00163DC44F|nr:putative quinol monooxygenase [Aureimonas mangrovi]
MIVVAGYLRFSPETLDSLRPLARETVEMTRAEAGCIVYAFSEDMAEPGLLRIYEEWQSAAHLDAHGQTPHIAAWRAALAEVEIIDRELKRVAVDGFSPFA